MNFSFTWVLKQTCFNDDTPYSPTPSSHMLAYKNVSNKLCKHLWETQSEAVRIVTVWAHFTKFSSYF